MPKLLTIVKEQKFKAKKSRGGGGQFDHPPPKAPRVNSAELTDSSYSR